MKFIRPVCSVTCFVFLFLCIYIFSLTLFIPFHFEALRRSTRADECRRVTATLSENTYCYIPPPAPGAIVSFLAQIRFRHSFRPARCAMISTLPQPSATRHSSESQAMKMVYWMTLLAILTAALAVSSSRPAVLGSTSCAVNRLRGGAGRRKHKTTHLHDIARNDSQNEYFAGGQDDQGGGSATTLIYPDEDKLNAKEAEPPPPPPPKFSGEGRQL